MPPPIPVVLVEYDPVWPEIADNEANYTCNDASFYGFVRAYLARLKPNAQPIGRYDLMLAAQALRLGATIVTNNTSEFARIPGLVVENWQS